MKMSRQVSGSRRVLFALVLACVLAAPSVRALDFGDYASCTLTTKAWDSMGSGAVDDALTYVDKCISMYEKQAKTMQASLTNFPSNNPKEETFKFWALNDVGSCWFIKGEILKQKSDLKGAKAAYETCAKEYRYCQCWDTKGWFWKPGEAARQKAVELKFDEQ